VLEEQMPHATPDNRYRLFQWLSGALVLALLLLVAWYFKGYETTSPATLTPQSDRSSLDDYAGSESCRECHQAEFDLWAASHHGLAERSFRPDLDEAAFSPSHKFTHASQTSEARMQDGQAHIVTLGLSNVAPHGVERVIGHSPLRQFLAPTAGGRWQPHELAFDPAKSEWFDIYGNEDRQPGEWGHWTGRGMNWNSQCAECHNTRLQKNYDAATDSYDTKMAEMGVGCEACHGPMKSHVKWSKAHPGSKEKDPTIKRLSPGQILETCGTCHSRQDNLTGDFVPGDSFFDHYSLEILDHTGCWYPDGQVRNEDYELASFLGSKMHSSGVRCVDCHNPHSAKILLPGNNLCMQCHSGGVTNVPVIVPAEHGHHKLTEAGSQCVGCHMPVTHYMQRHPRHDHGFTIPDPLLTKELGIPNACNRCHEDKSTDWAIEYAEKWYGDKMNRHTRERARWIASAQSGEDTGRDSLIRMLNSGKESFYWRGVAVSFLQDWAAEPSVKTTLVARLKDEHPLVRERAVQSLESIAGNPEVSTGLQPLLQDPALSVRVAAAWVLGMHMELPGEAERELQLALDRVADQPMGQYRKALLLLARQKPSEALQHLRKAVEWDTYSPPFRCKLAEVLARQGNLTEAVAVLGRGEQLVPSDPYLPYYRAKFLSEAGRHDDARTAVKRSLELRGDFPPAKDLLERLSSN
jgi:tetratricopeptide (TPR) repeat protein